MSLIRQSFVALPDAENQWNRFEQLIHCDYQDFFNGEGPIAGARAPGRLDVMGGVADYSGSIVLEMPIAQATFASWQWRSDRNLRIRSIGIGAEGLSPEVVISLDEMVDTSGIVRPIDEVRDRLSGDASTHWASYVAGCFYVMLAAHSKVAGGTVHERIGEIGANILIQSDVPLGAGVSSSAALEVSIMMALSEASGIHPSDLTLAAWCQRVENLIVGSPCGIMDQVTSALGIENSLTVLKCQPHDLLGAQPIPSGWKFVGIDSRVKHKVSGSHYTKARVGAFMGLKIIQLESGGKLLENYLCEMSPAEFRDYKHFLPESITGAEYERLYGFLPDTITKVDASQTYHPLGCAEHPILENDRAKQFVAIMHMANLHPEEDYSSSSLRPYYGPPDALMLREAGELMYEAHASYSDRLDLGSRETDILVDLIRDRGEECGLYGAKITGGGSGGTVAVLCREDTELAETALIEICEKYSHETGITPRAIIGSSPGAVSFGARHILRG